MLIGSVDCFRPELLSCLKIASEVKDARPLVQVVGPLSNEGHLHTVILIKVLFVVLNEQLPDFCKFALSFRDWLELNAFNEDFDQCG